LRSVDTQKRHRPSKMSREIGYPAALERSTKKYYTLDEALPR
jgi:hypothetical protein